MLSELICACCSKSFDEFKDIYNSRNLDFNFISRIVGNPVVCGECWNKYVSEENKRGGDNETDN